MIIPPDLRGRASATRRASRPGGHEGDSRAMIKIAHPWGG